MGGDTIGQMVYDVTAVGTQRISAILGNLGNVVDGDPIAILSFHVNEHLLGIRMGVGTHKVPLANGILLGGVVVMIEIWGA